VLWSVPPYGRGLRRLQANDVATFPAGGTCRIAIERIGAGGVLPRLPSSAGAAFIICFANDCRRIGAGGVCRVCFANAGGGDDRDRTGDPLLAKQVLSQLSYAPNLEI
jgi:hypothetical protein